MYLHRSQSRRWTASSNLYTTTLQSICECVRIYIHSDNTKEGRRLACQLASTRSSQSVSGVIDSTVVTDRHTKEDEEEKDEIQTPSFFPHDLPSRLSKYVCIDVRMHYASCFYTHVTSDSKIFWEQKEGVKRANKSEKKTWERSEGEIVSQL